MGSEGLHPQSLPSPAQGSERRDLRSTCMSTETGTEARSSVDRIPCEHGLEAWRRLAHRFDPGSAHANFKNM